MSYTALTTLAREKSIASSFISYLAFIWDVTVTHRACIHISNSHVVLVQKMFSWENRGKFFDGMFT
jgi:hypothetical protein